MSEEINKSKVFWGTFWSAMEALGRQGISFLIGLVLARLLFPSDYGLVGMLSIFLAISQVFIDCGFSNALICKRNNSQMDYSTAFLFNAGVGCVAYLVLFLISPMVADFYREPVLIPLLRIIGLNVVFNSLCIVQNAILAIDLKIKIVTKISIICQTSTGVLAILAAYKGYGVWALAAQSVASSLLTTALLWIYAGWKPVFKFSKESFRYLWNFGSKMLFVGLVSNIYKNLFGLIIGKRFDPASLGLYNKAQNLADLYPKTIYSFTNRVSLPTLAAFKDDREMLKKVFRKYMKITGYVVFPVAGIMFVVAHPLIVTLWSTRWVDSVVLFQILCLGSMWDPFNLFSLNVLQAIGRPDITLKVELANKFVGILLIMLTLKYGLTVFVCGRAFYNFYEYMVNMNCTRTQIGYRIKEQIGDLAPSLLLTLVAMAVTRAAMCMPLQQWGTLAIAVLLGISSYLVLSILFRLEGLCLIRNILPGKNE